MTYIQNGEQWGTTRGKINKVLKISGTDLLADTTLTYTADVAGSVNVGDLFGTTEGQWFEVAASDASDQHQTTAGGVKLYEAGPNFSTRARMVSRFTRMTTASEAPPVGTVWSDGAVSYVYDGSTTAITDMSGWSPYDSVDVRHFGATGDGTNATTAVQAANDYLASLTDNAPADGPQFLDFGPGQYWCDPLTIGSTTGRIIWRGKGMASTFIVCNSGTNADFIRSADFASLTGTNTWLNGSGVPSMIGFEHMTINGNKANQTAGDAVQLYAKALYFNHVQIINAKENGLYTECGTGGSVSTWPTLPEGDINSLHITGADGIGWHARGCADMRAGHVTISITGSHGFMGETVSGTSQATMDIGHLHAYSCGGKAIYLKDGCTIRAALLRGEDCDEEGIYLENNDYCIVASAHSFNACRVSGSHQIHLDADTRNCTFGSVLSRTMGRAAAGALFDGGQKNSFGTVSLRGDVSGGGNSTGSAIELGASASNSSIKGTVSDFSGAGAACLEVNGADYSDIDLTVYGGTIGLLVTSEGFRNNIKINGNLDSGGTAVSGTLTSATDYEIHLHDGSTGHDESHVKGDFGVDTVPSDRFHASGGNARFVGNGDFYMFANASNNTGSSNYLMGDSDGDFRGGIIYNHSDDSLGIYANGVSTPDLEIDSSGNILAAGPFRCPSYTVATAPSASTAGAGSLIYVTDETGGATHAASDGTNWRRMSDRAIIS